MFFDLILNLGAALSTLFELGFEIKEHYFYELTSEQYKQLEVEDGSINKRWYMILPDNYKYHTSEALIVSEPEKNSLLHAAKLVENYCQNKTDEPFNNYQEKLQYVAQFLPPVFSENSEFKPRHLKIVE